MAQNGLKLSGFRSKLDPHLLEVREKEQAEQAKQKALADAWLTDRRRRRVCLLFASLRGRWTKHMNHGSQLSVSLLRSSECMGLKTDDFWAGWMDSS